jgi:hypothetical protein
VNGRGAIGAVALLGAALLVATLMGASGVNVLALVRASDAVIVAGVALVPVVLWRTYVYIDRNLRPAEYVPTGGEVVEEEEAAEEEEEGEKGEPPTPDADSAKIVADLAAKAFSDEHDAGKALDTKASTFIAFTGAAALFAAGVVARPPDGLTAAQRGVFVIAACAPLIVLGFALVFLFLALKARVYQEIDLSAWVSYSIMDRSPGQLYARMASTYENAVEANHNVNAIKAQRLAWGLRLLTAGVSLLLVLLASAALVVGLPSGWLPW